MKTKVVTLTLEEPELRQAVARHLRVRGYCVALPDVRFLYSALGGRHTAEVTVEVPVDKADAELTP